MILWLTDAPLWLSGLLLVGLTTVLAMFGPLLVRRQVTLERLSTNNEVAGFKFATVGVLFAVLLAFAVIVVWEKFSDAENDVAQEAGAAVTIYRLADGVPGDAGNALRTALSDYVRAAIQDDWPAMERGGASVATTRALDAVYAATLTFHPAGTQQTVVLAEILHQLDTMTQARRARLVVAAGIMPGIIWAVLFAGAIVTVGFTFFFGTRNLAAQVLMTGLLSVLIFSGLLIIVAIDHPFAGTVKVEPDPLKLALDDFGPSHGQ